MARYTEPARPGRLLTSGQSNSPTTVPSSSSSSLAQRTSRYAGSCGKADWTRANRSTPALASLYVASTSTFLMVGAELTGGD